MIPTLQLDSEYRTPTIEMGVTGPGRERGFVFLAPRSEGLLWDVESEIASSRRHWREDLGGWWIAGSYYRAVLGIAFRFFPSILVMENGEDRLISRDGIEARQERLL